MSLLFSSQFDLTKKGGRLKIVHLSQNLRELMTLTKLLTVFDVYEDESAALDSFMIDTAEIGVHPPVAAL